MKSLRSTTDVHHRFPRRYFSPGLVALLSAGRLQPAWRNNIAPQVHCSSLKVLYHEYYYRSQYFSQGFLVSLKVVRRLTNFSKCHVHCSLYFSQGLIPLLLLILLYIRIYICVCFFCYSLCCSQGCRCIPQGPATIYDVLDIPLCVCAHTAHSRLTAVSLKGYCIRHQGLAGIDGVLEILLWVSALYTVLWSRYSHEALFGTRRGEMMMMVHHNNNDNASVIQISRVFELRWCCC